jgi:hypothetical protein
MPFKHKLCAPAGYFDAGADLCSQNPPLPQHLPFTESPYKQFCLSSGRRIKGDYYQVKLFPITLMTAFSYEPARKG